MMRVTTVFVLALSIYGTAAIPSDADAVVPEDTLFQSKAHQFGETTQMLLEMKSQGNSDKDCRKLADSTDDSVKDNIKAEQDTLNKMEKGKECPSRGQKAVDRATDDLNKAQKKATDTAKKYAKTLDYRVDFGKYRFGGLTEGNCGVFFRSSAYTNAKNAGKAAKDAKLKAAGALDQAKKAQQTAIDDQKRAIRKCYCDLKKLHAKTRNDMNAKVEKANQKAWTRAAHIRCVLDGTPMAKCKVAAMPKVKKVSLTKAAETAQCSLWKGKYPQCKGVSNFQKKYQKSGFSDMNSINQYTRTSPQVSWNAGCYLETQINYPLDKARRVELMWQASGNGGASSQNSAAMWGVTNKPAGRHNYQDLKFAFYCSGKDAMAQIFEGSFLATNCRCGSVNRNTFTRMFFYVDGSVEYQMKSNYHGWKQCRMTGKRYATESYVVDQSVAGQRAGIMWIRLEQNNNAGGWEPAH